MPHIKVSWGMPYSDKIIEYIAYYKTPAEVGWALKHIKRVLHDTSDDIKIGDRKRRLDI